MHILLIPGWYPSPIHPTSGDFVQAQAKALQARGHQVGVLFSEYHWRFWRKPDFYRPKSKAQVEQGIPTFRKNALFPPKRSATLLKIWVKSYASLFEQYCAKHGQPDLLHAHVFLGGIAAQYLAQKYQLPYLITEHSADLYAGKFPNWKKRLIKSAYAEAKVVIAVGAALGEHIQIHFPQTKTTVIPNFIDLDVFHSGSAKASDFTFIAVGEMVPIKQYDVLIRAFAKFAAKENGRLLLIGAGPEESTLRQLARKWNIQDQVVFKGWLSPNGSRTIGIP